MKKKLLLFFTFFCIFGLHQNIKGQTLGPGDIAFIGFDTGGLDGFSFIALKNLPAGEVVYFTEEGLSANGWIGSNEPHIKWTIPSGVTCGKIISIIETATNNVFTVTGGSTADFVINPEGPVYSFNLAAGDQMLAYQSVGNAMRPTISPATITFLAGVHGDYNPANYDTTTHWNSASVTAGLGGAESILPQGLTNGVNCVSLFPGGPEPSQYFAKYTGTLVGTSAVLRASISDYHNWTITTTTSTPAGTQGILPSNYTPNVTCTSVPTVTSNTSVTNFGAITASLGGTNDNGGDSSVLDRGIVWSLTTNPVIGGTGVTKVAAATLNGTGAFTVNVTGLPAGTTIYYRAYAENSVGTAYGNTISFVTNAALSATQSQTAACNGSNNATATVTPSGGKAPYSYLWSNGTSINPATGLAGNANYSVLITDSENTSISRNFTIVQNSAISGGTTITNVSCNGGNTGAIDLTPSGGTAPYTYNWGGGITTQNRTGLVAGSYSVIITDSNNCSVTVSNIVVVQPAAVNGTTSITTVACNGGSTGAIDLTPSGGNAPYTFLWNDGVTTEDRTGIPVGSYSVTIKDANNCTKIVSGIIVTQPSLISTSATLTHLACFGGNTGSISLNPTGGGGGYSFLWNDGVTTQNRTGLTAGTYNVTITDANSCSRQFSFTLNQPASALGGSVTVGNVSCNGGSNGSIDLTPTGGTLPYTYNWNNGTTTQDRTGITAGTYSVTITDAYGCSFTINNISVGQPNAPLSALTGGGKTDVSCYGGGNGTATVSPTGGTPTYTYSWSTTPVQTTATATGLSAGTYTVTVTDANSCQATRTFTIGQPAAALNALTGGSQTNVSCNGGANGTATVAPTGGTPAYTYSWNTTPVQTTATATGLSAGTYTVTVTDANACQATRSFTIIQPTVLNALTGGGKTDVSCNGGANGTATVAPTGGTPAYTYSWNTTPVQTTATATGLSAGTYTVTVTDANACQATRTFTISQPTALNLSLAAGKTDVSCYGGGNGTATVAPTGGTPNYTYSWNTTPVQTTATATGLSAGTYTVTVTDANACQATRSFTIGQPAAALNALTGGGKTDVSCNGGANGTATVAPTGGTPTYTYSWNTTPVQTTATATGLSAGTYTVTVTDANACQVTRSFTITQPTVLNVLTGGGKTDVSCNGGANGTATVAPTGGTPTYTYSWNTTPVQTTATATGLSAGTYTVTVTDANACQATRSFTITQPTVLNALTGGGKTDVSCNGGANGTATVAPTGGTPTYTYSWNTTPVQTTATATGLSAGTYTVTVTDANACQTTRSFTIGEPAALSALTGGSKTDVSCNGGSNGSATVAPTGGTPTYTYSWAPSGGTAATATGLSAGTYTVTVTDANACQTTRSFTIGQPPILSASKSSTDVLCYGTSTGSATVTPTGGTGIYTYAWAPSGGTAATATGLATGNYTCTITDGNGCSLTESFFINQPTALAATTSQINATCSTGGQASVTASGGVFPYSYLWTPVNATTSTVTNLTAGNYSCLITDANGCSITKNFTITTTNTLVAITSQTDLLCNGTNTGVASVIPSGAPGPFTYVWSPTGGNAATATGLSAGNYSVTITSNNGCSIVKNFTINQPPAIVVTKTSQTNVSCFSGANGSLSVAVTGGTGAYSYAWAPSGGTAATATGLSAGTYSISVTDANGCVRVENYTITQPNALTPSISKTDVSCNGGSNGSATVSVTGGTGAYTYSWAPSGGTAATATGLTAGNYVVTITDANACQTTASVLIEQPTLLEATLSKTDVLCNQANNGTATVTASGGTGNYTYLWSPSGGTAATATGLSPNIYTVQVTDENGCFITKTIEITEPTALLAVDSHVDVTCNGGNNGTASVVATGGTGNYSYLWAPSGGTAATATGLTAGTYTVTVTDQNLCSVVNTIVIEQPDALDLTTTIQAVSCYEGNNGSATVNVTGGTGAYSYSWSPSGGNGATATGLIAGMYTVTVTDANSCTASATVEITQPSSPVTLNTAIISRVTVSGAALSGIAYSDGINTDQGQCIAEVGFVYALHTSPTTADTKINVASTLGTFTNNLSGLRGNRTYYVRTYAINSNGYVNYGNEVSFTTQKYTLSITATAGHTKVYGTADPVFDYTAAGFENGDTSSILTGSLSRDAGENVGTYNITLGSLNAGDDYVIDFTGAQFGITKANQTITWNQTLEFGCIDSDNVTLTATSDSGLPITYTIANAALGTISGATLNIKGSGNSTITAVQNGDQNHNAATAVVKPIEISQSGLVVQQWANVLFFDNSSKNYVAWQWYKDGVAISGATRQYYSEVQPLNGSYYVISKDINGNSIKSCPIETTGTVFTKKIKIYPNPVKPGAEFTLECDFSDSQLNGSEVVIYDITGKLVQTISNVKAKNQIIAPSQVALYVVVLKLANGQLKTINLLVK